MLISTFVHHEKFKKIREKFQSFPIKVFDDAIELHEKNFSLIKNTIATEDFYYVEGSIVVLENDAYLDCRYQSLLFSTWETFLTASIHYLEKRKELKGNYLPEMPIDMLINTFDDNRVSVGFYSKEENDIYLFNAGSFFNALVKKCDLYTDFMSQVFINNHKDINYLKAKNDELKKLVSTRYGYH